MRDEEIIDEEMRDEKSKHELHELHKLTQITKSAQLRLTD